MAYSIPVPKEVVEQIQELVPLARLARRQHTQSDPKVVASRTLSEVFVDLQSRGCSIPTIAKAAGMTYHSVSARIQKAKNTDG